MSTKRKKTTVSVTDLAGSVRNWGREKRALNGRLSVGVTLSHLQKQEVPWGRTINVTQQNADKVMKQPLRTALKTVDIRDTV